MDLEEALQKIEELTNENNTYKQQIENFSTKEENYNKHTYKLDKTTNNYYWVSSEPIEYNE